MGHHTPQFTAEQILAAARRAEAEGRRDYAYQFYRHLAEQHATAPEALLARDALARLAPTSTPAAGPPQARSDLASRLGNITNGEAAGRLASGPAPQRSAPQLAIDPFAAGAPHRDPRQPPSLPQQPHAPPQAPPVAGLDLTGLRLPPRSRRYRLSRMLAGLVALLGWLSVAGAAALVAVALLLPDIAGRLGGGLPALSFAASAFGMGLVLVLLGQAMRVLFDMANAARDTAEVVRAIGEHVAGETE